MYTQKKKHAEFILALRAQAFAHPLFERKTPEQTVFEVTDRDFMDWVNDAAQSHLIVGERSWLEQDPTYRQVLPYIVLYRINAQGQREYFAYRRTSGVGESRLAGNASVGVGGHLDVQDLRVFDDTNILHFFDSMTSGATREIAEEVKIHAPASGDVGGLLQYDLNGMIPSLVVLDDTNEVGQVHAGMVFFIEVPADATVTVAEEELEQFAVPMQTAQALLESDLPLENWTRMVLEHEYAFEQSQQALLADFKQEYRAVSNASHQAQLRTLAAPVPAEKVVQDQPKPAQVLHTVGNRLKEVRMARSRGVVVDNATFYDHHVEVALGLDNTGNPDAPEGSDALMAAVFVLLAQSDDWARIEAAVPADTPMGELAMTAYQLWLANLGRNLDGGENTVRVTVLMKLLRPLTKEEEEAALAIVETPDEDLDPVIFERLIELRRWYSADDARDRYIRRVGARAIASGEAAELLAGLTKQDEAEPSLADKLNTLSTGARSAAFSLNGGIADFSHFGEDGVVYALADAVANPAVDEIRIVGLSVVREALRNGRWTGIVQYGLVLETALENWVNDAVVEGQADRVQALVAVMRRFYLGKYMRENGLLVDPNADLAGGATLEGVKTNAPDPLAWVGQEIEKLQASATLDQKG